MAFEVDDEQVQKPEGEGEAASKPETVTMSKAEFESLRRERDEARESERYWASMARPNGNGQPQQAEEQNEDDPGEFVDEEAAGGAGIEGDTPEKLVDELAAEGVSAISKRGFITAKDAHRIAAEIAVKVSRELITRERQKITSDAQIMAEFPELRDQNSDLFKETAKRYQRAVAMDPNAKKTPVALMLAAEAARESLRGRGRARQERSDEYESEEDRRMRVASQDARSRPRADAEEFDDMLGDQARAVIKGMGITEDEFKKSATEIRGARAARGRR